ncbi:M81 family metallopeptidase [Holdemania massiliensis]|uniref:Microcystin degradation protein MlrC n=1 Tax=Holdemania massiliensis TaxID=1468449 RepID=A0A6N7S5F6_9FIRM|nr:M81 family metallopeptidase [Holdemania massiliensis]MSA70455.1 microcystin degradation protein MlrC [Holdemania massiliensis]MSA88912.1 microcystin degradation protein MlrC [Holdemania massiliensis]MSB77533.1 microcystin degradation protein MlrC [Holdemania massiliensis]MSC32459.1 microcystin degradation protein MlrC [Holdemania massiliensis]MSC38779.1 microcystin degradation protein MlrC [Holdemania massiliensis]
MKVLIGHFTTEANAHIPMKNNLSHYELAFGEELIERMKVREVFEQAGIEIIPSIYAGGGPSGVIEKETFLTIENSLLSTIKKHKHEIDGIYLWLHGASWVEDIGSGDFHIIAKIRELVGPYLPIAVSCDPHGNLTEDYVHSLQILRSFRQSPHTDMVETYRKVAAMLCDLLKNRQHIHPAYRKLPLILGGEQSVSADEPVRSINAYMDQLEQDPRIRSVSWHVGYLRHDCPEAGCGVVVVPQTEADQAYAEAICGKLADYVWQRRHEFHYTGTTADPEAALQMALNFEGKPFVLTDSGDNTTSGATGWNTFVLRQFLALPELNKSVLFAGICDPKTCAELRMKQIGDAVEATLGVGEDELSKPVRLEGVIQAKGDVIRIAALGRDEYTVMGHCVSLTLTDWPMTVIITDHRQAYCHTLQFEHAGITDWTQFAITVVKQGYIFPELKAAAQGYVMSLTEGATPQDTKNIPFKQIQRPMYPIDEI